MSHLNSTQKLHLLNYTSHSLAIQTLNRPIFKKIFAQLLKFLLTLDISGKLHFHLYFSGPYCTFMLFHSISHFLVNFYEDNHELCEVTKAIFGRVTFVCTWLCFQTQIGLSWPTPIEWLPNSFVYEDLKDLIYQNYSGVPAFLPPWRTSLLVHSFWKLDLSSQTTTLT